MKRGFFFGFILLPTGLERKYLLIMLKPAGGANIDRRNVAGGQCLHRIHSNVIN